MIQIQSHLLNRVELNKNTSRLSILTIYLDFFKTKSRHKKERPKQTEHKEGLEIKKILGESQQQHDQLHHCSQQQAVKKEAYVCLGHRHHPSLVIQGCGVVVARALWLGTGASWKIDQARKKDIRQRQSQGEGSQMAGAG